MVGALFPLICSPLSPSLHEWQANLPNLLHGRSCNGVLCILALRISPSTIFRILEKGNDLWGAYLISQRNRLSDFKWIYIVFQYLEGGGDSKFKYWNSKQFQIKRLNSKLCYLISTLLLSEVSRLKSINWAQSLDSEETQSKGMQPLDVPV